MKIRLNKIRFVGGFLGSSSKSASNQTTNTASGSARIVGSGAQTNESGIQVQSGAKYQEQGSLDLSGNHGTVTVGESPETLKQISSDFKDAISTVAGAGGTPVIIASAPSTEKSAVQFSDVWTWIQKNVVVVVSAALGILVLWYSLKRKKA